MSTVAAETAAMHIALRAWRPFALIIATMVAIIALYWQSYLPMVRMWSLATYQYGWLVFPISIVMLWHVRERINRTHLAPSWPGFAAVAAVVMLWTMAEAVSVQVIEFIAATLLVPAVVWAVGGTALLRAALFPLVFLVAAVPVGEAMIPALMRSTADIATWMLDLVGVPAFREGMFLTLPGGHFEVADVCSGLRYLLVGTVIAILFAYWNYNSLRKRVIFVTAVALSFIVANGIRAFIVMYIASATDMSIFAGRDHIIFGQILFIVLAFVLMYVGRRYSDDPDRSDASQREVTPHPHTLHWRPLIIGLAVTVLVFGPFGRQLRAGSDSEATLPLPNIVLNDCQQEPAWLPVWQPVLQSPAAESATTWRCGDTQISVYQAGYREQTQGKELVSSANELWPYDWRRNTSTTTRTLTVAGKELSAIEVFRNTQPSATLIWYWYDIEGMRTRNPYVVKILEALHALRLRTPDAALVMIVAEGTSDRDALTTAAERAVRDL